MNWITEIPYGLILCRLDGVQVSVTAVGLTGLQVRSSRPLPGKTLELHLYEIRKRTYTPLRPENWHVSGQESLHHMGIRTTITLQDPRYRQKMQALLRTYGQYIQDKQDMDEAEMAAAYLGCPVGGETSECLKMQKIKWFQSAMETLPEGEWELALSLDAPWRYEIYLQCPLDAFQTHFLAENGLGHHRLLKKRATRIYIGNAWCGHLCPDQNVLKRMCQKAKAENTSVTLVLPGRREQDGLMIPEDFAGEIEVNDWGTLYKLRGRKLILGPMLNRRRKDPRMRAEDAVPENSLNDPEFRKWLQQMGVERLEYESCGYIASLAKGRHSLHLPFYQTNTSHDCILSAQCRGQDPGVAHGACAQECRQYALLYPDEQNLVGRYNSIFGRDADILSQCETLQAWMAQGIDRLVVEGL